MTAATQSGTIQLESVGSLTLRIIPFTSVTNAYTYTSGIQDVVGYWAGCNVATGTTGAEGVDVVLTTASSGLFTFYCAEVKTAVSLFVLSRG